MLEKSLASKCISRLRQGFCKLLPVLLSLFFIPFHECLAAPLPAFPGATGFGSRTVHGSGRHLSPPQTEIIRVTSLDDSGEGSLRACIIRDKPRVCVFEVAGAIILKKALKIAAPYITIAGQTAPEPGILIRGAGLEVDTHDVLIQHLEIRPGDEEEGPNPVSRDGISVVGENSAYNVFLDHLSVSWGVDENASTGQANVHDVTYSYCIIAEALRHSIHPKGIHSMGILIGDDSKNISVHHSLFAHNYERNPRLKPGVTAEFLNNVVYHWGGKSGWNQANVSDTEGTNKPTLFNFAGNFYKAGPESPKTITLFGKPASPLTRVYVAHNIGPLRLEDEGDDWALAGIPEHPHRSLNPAFPPSGVLITPPEETWRTVLLGAGSRSKTRNTTDVRILEEVKTGSGSFKDCIQGCKAAVGKWPTPTEHQRTLSIPMKPQHDDNKDGYTNLENWLHDFAAEVE